MCTQVYFNLDNNNMCYKTCQNEINGRNETIKCIANIAIKNTNLANILIIFIEIIILTIFNNFNYIFNFPLLI